MRPRRGKRQGTGKLRRLVPEKIAASRKWGRFAVARSLSTQSYAPAGLPDNREIWRRSSWRGAAGGAHEKAARACPTMRSRTRPGLKQTRISGLPLRLDTKARVPEPGTVHHLLEGPSDGGNDAAVVLKPFTIVVVGLEVLVLGKVFERVGREVLEVVRACAVVAAEVCPKRREQVSGTLGRGGSQTGQTGEQFELGLQARRQPIGAEFLEQKGNVGVHLRVGLDTHFHKIVFRVSDHAGWLTQVGCQGLPGVRERGDEHFGRRQSGEARVVAERGGSLSGRDFGEGGRRGMVFVMRGKVGNPNLPTGF